VLHTFFTKFLCGLWCENEKMSTLSKLDNGSKAMISMYLSINTEITEINMFSTDHSMSKPQNHLLIEMKEMVIWHKEKREKCLGITKDKN
jgi:hypothetical protein